MAFGGGNAASIKVESMDTTQNTSFSKTTARTIAVDKGVSSSAVKIDTTTATIKEDSDVVSQTRSGSAPVSVISSAQSLDPSKKDSASRDAYFAVKYNALLANIAEVGRDVKPAYTNNKSSSERLRKNIVLTRNTIRDLMIELEKYSRIAEENDSGM